MISILQFLAVENLRDANIFAAVTSQKRFPGAFAVQNEIRLMWRLDLHLLYQICIRFSSSIDSCGPSFENVPARCARSFSRIRSGHRREAPRCPFIAFEKGRSGAEIREQFAKDKALTNGMIKTIGDKFFGQTATKYDGYGYGHV